MEHCSGDEFYIFQSKYYELKEWSSKIPDPKITCEMLIQVLDVINTDMNSYVCPVYQAGKKNTWLPLATFVSRFPYREKLLKYLFSHGARPQKLTDPDGQNICFQCDEKYLKKLLKLAPPKTNLVKQITDKLVAGNYRRLALLFVEDKIFTEEILTEVTASEELVGQMLNALISRILLTINQDPGIEIEPKKRKHRSNAPEPNVGPPLNKTKIVTDLVGKYLICFRMMQPHGLTFTIENVQKCVDHYLYEILDLISAGNEFEPKYHSDMDEQTVAALRPLLNDYRYVQTCKVLDWMPDERVW